MTTDWLRGAMGSLALAACMAGAPSAASAQVVPAPITAGWQDGFVIQSPNGDNRLVLGILAQTDGRFSVDDPTPITNTFLIRRARPTLSGRVAKYFEFKLMPDFGNGTATLTDAYLDLRFANAFRVRTGKDKTPVGYELLMGGDGLSIFPERALPTNLVPNRDVGVQVVGDAAGGKLSYAGGVFNGIPDGANSSTDLDTNNGKDLAGRIVIQPFRSTSAHASPLGGIGFHFGGSTGTETGALPALKTSVGQTYFAYANTSSAGGRRTRWTPAAFYYYKSLAAFAEYIRSDQQVIKSGVVTGVDNRGWELTGSIVLTGEAATDRGVRPAKPFDPASHTWGALQLSARYARVTVDQSAFTSGLAAAGASPDASSFAVGLNWYPNAFLKYWVALERVTFGAGQTNTRPSENTIQIRAQIGF